jgi:hypothetical protein
MYHIAREESLPYSIREGDSKSLKNTGEERRKSVITLIRETMRDFLEFLMNFEEHIHNVGIENDPSVLCDECHRFSVP